MADQTELSTLAFASWPADDDERYQPQHDSQLDQWQVPDDSPISNFYDLCGDYHEWAHNWLFFTQNGKMCHLFGSSNTNLRLERFLIVGGNLRMSISLSSFNSDGSSYLGPIRGVSSDESVAPNIFRVDIYTCSNGLSFGVKSIQFIGQDHVGLNPTCGLRTSLELQDIGCPNAEHITEICALQDDKILYAIQIITNRGRASTVDVPAHWENHVVTTPEHLCQDLQTQLDGARKFGKVCWAVLVSAA
jgi:hypothetical protein